MKHPHELAVTRATQSQSAMWSREASYMLALLQTTPPGSLYDYRRMRCIVAQTNAATYHEWVAKDL